MVKGLEKFKEFFRNYTDNYVIIGGTACDIIISDATFTPRATKDIDIILIVEALNADFVKHFWKFVKAANYERQDVGGDERKYYRFTKPTDNEFPLQIELFSRKPDVILLEKGVHLTPIPVDDDLSSLSAILLNDDYYNYMIQHSSVRDDIRLANIEALICLKAKAFLEISERIAKGIKEDAKHLRKHKTDVFRLALMLTPDKIFKLPLSLKNDMQSFVNTIAANLPEKAIFKEMGAGIIDVDGLYQQILKSFILEKHG
ncbi:MAG: hypothetical protein CVU05_08225 [Bacteroidetes bacterium HGW-Bacteroidetes-21]|jgi:hypothetical protein|nr:MAG: hypothetical protein CVU05_08225 [Bacteroidetes bacterium HGW-Bacteroidetes-21]